MFSPQRGEFSQGLINYCTKPSEGDWIEAHDNLDLVGPAGVGKSWLACAIGQKACRDNRSVLYHSARTWRSPEATGAIRA